MLIPCQKCEKPACAITPPAVSNGEAFALRKMLGGLGVDLGGALALITDPDAATISREFAVMCTGCAS